MVQYYNALIGVALGDMMGLYYEGLSAKSIAKKEDDFLAPQLLLGKGVFSDDTEHSVIVAQCLTESFDDLERFEQLLRKRLQKWLFSLPAGVGFATLRGVVRSFFISQSGVFSAGNAPAMRAHLIGLLYGDDNKLKKFVKVNTYITHTDPKAYFGALVVAKASYLFAKHQEDRLWVWIEKNIQDREFQTLISQVRKHLHITTKEFAKVLGVEQGVSGYIYHTLPIALHSAYRHKDNLKAAIVTVIECGGDTDTVAAITGGIVGSRGGELPQKWIECIADYPINQKFMQKLMHQFEEMVKSKKSQKAPKVLWISSFMRNIIFLVVVLVSALRRVF